MNNYFLSILDYHSFELINLPKNSLISDKDQLFEASNLTEKIKMNKIHIDVLFVDVYKINAVWEEKIKTSTDMPTILLTKMQVVLKLTIKYII